jgi:poly-gamma-glutamate synthesis protein (capsule biosynthesis protein)
LDANRRAATVFLCGDVMIGRGIDQILARPGDPTLFEPYVTDAREYVALAENVSGHIARSAGDAYIWGDALAEFARRRPDARVANLETSITRAGEPSPVKSIHYRAHPDNAGCLTAAGIDICTLANNHVLDFGPEGLRETLDVLRGRGVATAGAGGDLGAAQAPAVLALRQDSRLLVWACGTGSSGIPREWGARPDHAGLYLIDVSRAAADDIDALVHRVKQPGDMAIVSIHWGDNWGYAVPKAHRDFAHWLIDGGVDLVYGHSSHHPRPIERYRGKLILYGCGDFVNDYEGIAGYEAYRADLVLMYFPTIATDSGELLSLAMVPMKSRALSLVRAASAEAQWLADTVARVSAPFGTALAIGADGAITLQG